MIEGSGWNDNFDGSEKVDLHDVIPRVNSFEEEAEFDVSEVTVTLQAGQDCKVAEGRERKPRRYCKRMYWHTNSLECKNWFIFWHFKFWYIPRKYPKYVISQENNSLEKLRVVSLYFACTDASLLEVQLVLQDIIAEVVGT